MFAIVRRPGGWRPRRLLARDGLRDGFEGELHARPGRLDEEFDVGIDDVVAGDRLEAAEGRDGRNEVGEPRRGRRRGGDGEDVIGVEFDVAFRAGDGGVAGEGASIRQRVGGVGDAELFEDVAGVAGALGGVEGLVAVGEDGDGRDVLAFERFAGIGEGLFVMSAMTLSVVAVALRAVPTRRRASSTCL
ncbi:hypothetical protein O0235_09465 [Tepidiforma flava]|uniref:Uncharacterized protein n=1 Tax=Tepidiforma flava TaxID=3004094 RepID=A0ABY7M2Z1_9CHLR|nr:hypothetical protein [Tepidiforma flava]WBL35015.1 hypothetical protein O0235_09465 [Tepidiforma flava]